MTNKFINNSYIKITLVIILFLVGGTHFISLWKPISGNPIIYNLCSKELANNFDLSLNYAGIINPFHCNFHSMLPTFLLAIPYKIFGSTVIVTKLFNFFLLSVFIIYFFLKEKNLNSKLFILSVWLSIPLIFQSLHNTDPDSNIGVLLIGLLFFQLNKKNLKDLNFIYISLVLFLIIWTKEFSGIMCSIALIVSVLFFKNEVRIKILLSIIFSWIFFIITYLLVVKFFSLPPSNIISLFKDLSSINIEESLSFSYVWLFGFKGLIKWLGSFFLFIIFFNFANQILLKFKNKIEFNLGYFFSIISLFGGVVLVLITGSHNPRYLISFLFPAIFVFCSYNSNYKENNYYLFRSLILLILFYGFLIFVTKDLVSITSNMRKVDIGSFLKLIILFSPLIFYLIFQVINRNNIFSFKNEIIILFLILPNCILNLSQSLSKSQYGTQMQGLIGFKETVIYIKNNEHLYDQIFVDHIDIGFYLENPVAHLIHPGLDIPTQGFSEAVPKNLKQSLLYSYDLDSYFFKLRREKSNFKYLFVIRTKNKKIIQDNMNFNLNKRCSMLIGDFILIENCKS